ncbi:MAG: hypothetical protein E6Q99_03600 [Elusimicrobia bacterium]|nr:MAG: hypothetical protein E6Q99_03600 [Elusimicrobiota bacterium]
MSQRASSNRKTIKDILAGQNLISPVDMAKAEAEATKTKKPLQQVVVDLGFVDKLSVLQALAAEWEVQPVLFDEVQVDGRVAKLISDAMARKHGVLPFLREDGIVLIAMADPRDPLLLEDLRAKTGEEVRPFLAMPEDIEKELDRIYGTALDHD